MGGPAVTAERPSYGRAPTRARVFAGAALGLAIVGGLVAAARSQQTGNGFLAFFCLSLPLAIAALLYGRHAETLVVDVDGDEGDEAVARSARRIAVAAIVTSAALTLGLGIWSAWDGLQDVGDTFFSWEHIRESFPDVAEGFWLNIQIFVIAEALVLVWGLVVATMRRSQGRASAPLRWFAVVYVDVFRGLPAIITIYLVGFGLPLTSLPVVSNPDLSIDIGPIHLDQLACLGILALTLVYGAYVAEVFRSGIESIHWSQDAAARGIGLSRGQSLRFVVVPQAIRRVVPPLMNDFIGLQKDTALLNLLGVLEGFNIARIYAGNSFNLSAVTGLGICFLVITIPMTRFADYLVKRDQKRLQASAG